MTLSDCGPALRRDIRQRPHPARGNRRARVPRNRLASKEPPRQVAGDDGNLRVPLLVEAGHFQPFMTTGTRSGMSPSGAFLSFMEASLSNVHRPSDRDPVSRRRQPSRRLGSESPARRPRLATRPAQRAAALCVWQCRSDVLDQRRRAIAEDDAPPGTATSQRRMATGPESHASDLLLFVMVGAAPAEGFRRARANLRAPCLPAS